MAELPPIDQEITDTDKMMGLLCYVITLLIPLIVLLSETGKSRAFQRYHAIQSLGLSAAWFIFALLLSIPVCILGVLTGGCGFCLLPIYFLPWIAALYYGLQAYQGEYAEIPVVTDFMVQQGWLQKP